VINPDTDEVIMHFHEKAAKEQRLMEEGVSAVMQYDDSLMVITTATRILIYNRLRNRTRILGTPETMSGFTASLQKDNQGNLWISTTTALYRANIKTRVFVRFNRDDGITNDYFILSSSYKLPDGRLLFGSSAQFVVFNPSFVSVSTAFPNITITDFKVMNESLPVDSLMQLKQIKLGYEDNSLSVDFSTLGYISAYMIQYRLQGIDKEWKTADNNNQAIYSYLPPAKYELQFKTIDSDGKVKLSSLQLSILIVPPFWKTWWFYSLLALAAGGLLFWLDKGRMQRKETLQKMRTDIAGNLHEEINTALNNINILSEMAKLKADSEPEKSKEFIEQINSKSHNMIIAMDDMLWSISPDNDSMEKTVERMREYIDALQKRHDANISLLVDKKIEKLVLNMKLRHEAFILFKEGIKSLMTAGVKNCGIQIGFEKNKLLYTMQFNNAGCDRQQLNNLLQRQDMERHVAAMKATIDVQVHKANSIFILQVPVS
jgi:signal transduction histidine kinase